MGGEGEGFEFARVGDKEREGRGVGGVVKLMKQKKGGELTLSFTGQRFFIYIYEVFTALGKGKRSTIQSLFTTRTIRSCLEGLALMI